MDEQLKKPRVGVGVMILKNSEVLLGKRHEDPEKADSELHGEGTWTMPGGKLEFQEGLEACARREVGEETGLVIKDLEIFSVSNDRVPDNHFITVGFLTTVAEGEPKIMEPDEITEWRWFSFDKLPENIFSPSRKMIKNYLAKKFYQED